MSAQDRPFWLKRAPRRRKNDVEVIGETETAIQVRWKRPHPGTFRSGSRWAYRNGRVVRIDPRTGKEWKE